MPSILQSLLTPSQLIIDLMVLFMLIGAVDHLIGNKLGLGPAFLEGFAAFGSIAPTMAGIIVLVPLIERMILPLAAPLQTVFGMDPAILSGMLLACDMGAWPLAGELASTPQGQALGGMILSSMMGVNIVFNIPVALGIVKPEDHPAMVKGILCGFITIPIGCFVGGLASGASLGFLLLNLIPILLVSAVICAGLLFFPRLITRIFLILGRIIQTAAIAACVLAIAASLTGINLVPGLGSIHGAMDTVIAVVLVLPGAYVLVQVISRLLRKPFAAAGSAIGLDDKSAVGLVTTLANAVPTFHLIGDMNERGKVVNFAFLVSAGYLLGDHLAFCSAMEPTLSLPMLIGKAAGGVTAVLLALLFTRKKRTD